MSRFCKINSRSKNAKRHSAMFTVVSSFFAHVYLKDLACSILCYTVCILLVLKLIIVEQQLLLFESVQMCIYWIFSSQPHFSRLCGESTKCIAEIVRANLVRKLDHSDLTSEMSLIHFANLQQKMY